MESDISQFRVENTLKQNQYYSKVLISQVRVIPGFGQKEACSTGNVKSNSRFDRPRSLKQSRWLPSHLDEIPMSESERL